jgi:hypothetical protein
MTDAELDQIQKRADEAPSPARVAHAVADRGVIGWIAFAQADLPALVAYARKAKAMLRRAQWGAYGGGDRCCPVCSGLARHVNGDVVAEHGPTCELAALIR